MLIYAGLRVAENHLFFFILKVQSVKSQYVYLQFCHIAMVIAH